MMKLEKKKSRDCLASEFEIKELEKLKYFLGIEVAYSKLGIFISQRNYVLDLLKETKKLGSKSTNVSIEKNHKLGKEEIGNVVDKGSYQRLVGKLIYLSHTRPNIAYAISIVSQFIHDPREKHLLVVHRILQYLKATPRRGLLFQKGGEFTLEVYTDRPCRITC